VTLFETIEEQRTLRPLRDYQQRSVTNLRLSISKKGNGWRCPVLYLPTGAGKTQIAVQIISNALSRGNRVLFVVPLLSLLGKTIKVFESQGITDIGVIQRRHSRTDPGARVQVASKQTLIKRPELMKGFDVVIDDECFPAGTLISTPRGPKPIEQMAPGDIVSNAAGTGRVISLFRKSQNKFVTVRLSDGTSFRCTPDHPVFTLSGWVEAGNLGIRQRVFREEDVLVLRESFRSIFNSERGTHRKAGSRGEFREARMLFSILCEEAEEPDAFGVHTGEGVFHSEEDRPRSTSRRQRPTDSSVAVRDTIHTGKRVGDGTCSKVASEATDVRLLLQTGSGELGSDDRDRVGWCESLLTHTTGTRPKEGCSSSLVWVEDIEVEELSCAEPVYNLRVSGHPSYFANGFLVHNCHRMYAEFSAWMKRDTKTVFIGLSASPGTKGMGLVYDGVVVGASIAELLEKGAICPFEVYDHGTAPSRKKLKVVNGEYSDTQTEAIMSDKVLVADVYKMWQERGSHAKWFVFCQTCAHAKLVMESFAIEGVRCGYIDADTPQDERDTIFDAYRSGDIDVMFSVGCLGTGVDELVYGISLAYITRSRDKLTQDLGRGGRPAEGKKVCWVNDHGGNIENLGAPEDYDYSELCCKDPKEKGDSRIDEQKVATQKKCGKCFILLPPKTSVCPKCGEKPAVCKIETVEGTLVKREKKPPKPKKDDKQAFYSGLLSIAQERGYKPGWVANQYRANFGVWPKGLVDFPVRPTPTVRKFIHDKQLAYFNSKTKEASHETV
jgi:DNA repair protein RadD